jgi:3-dehydroquinate synthase
MNQVTVDVGCHRYPIHIDSGLIADKNYCSPFIHSSQVLVVTNETVKPLYLPKLLSALNGYQVDVFTMPDGEAFKSFETFQSIIELLIDNQFRRNATIIALGGGVVGDISGFAAACYQRGIPFIQVPTTLLAMVDSSVGGKTAINHPRAKNMIGAFYQPEAVIADLDCLKTLPAREFAAGMAEVIKYGLIYDFALFQYLEANIDSIKSKQSEYLQTIIAQCCSIKAEVVQQDEKEKGIRGILNLGHTFGHAVEKAGNYQRFLHGEAVAIGTCMAFALAKNDGQISSEYFNRVIDLFQQYDLPTFLSNDYSVDALIETMKHDKKNKTENITLIIPLSEGVVEITERYSLDAIRNAISLRLKK